MRRVQPRRPRQRARRPTFNRHLSLWLDLAIVRYETATTLWERRFWRRVKGYVERRIGL
jgi:hypothetical protein